MKTVELQTKCGKIQGIDGENCFEFRGIKYANAKRWEYPQVIEKWQGVFDATCFKECSYQHRGFAVISDFLTNMPQLNGLGKILKLSAETRIILCFQVKAQGL